MPDAPAGTALAGGTDGPRALRPLLDTVLDALTTGAQDRSGPLPPGGPDTVARHVRDACLPLLPEEGAGPHTALRTLVHTLAAGAADPADPHCAAHLHCPPLAVAAAADLAASALNPSLDSWDQAPAASALEALTARTLAALVHPRADAPDALVTTGGTESNQLAVLLAREAARGTGREGGAGGGGSAWGAGYAGSAGDGWVAGGAGGVGRAGARGAAGPLRIVCGANAHHSIHRAAWLLGLPEPLTLPTPNGTLDPHTVHTCLTELAGPAARSGPTSPRSPVLLVATAGTTDSGAIDPLPALADLAEQHGARFHIDASYGGPLLFSSTHHTALTGLSRAHTVTLDLHKLGWQPVAAGLLAVPTPTTLAPLAHQADYLNADDDTEAGLPDLLGRSLRTTRRPDILKIAATLKALGRQGLGDLVDRTLAAARTLADLIEDHPRLELHSRPTLTTVLFRPTGADDTTLATIRRTLLAEGHAVLGRATTPTGLWLKVTLLNPHTQPGDLTTLLKLVEGHTPR
ncbi:pyridoxal-dependent decarboxylase [Streptomyces sp. RS10V-4]|uniref:pyridoxal phosphate-dependent decarboxylase family protein n=1 Tax=Streptomyces rhizoryzae TaxID=2932493 RepID=UPI002004D660|nr:pyridoxal-dependent decarboxylase [Streptomyces rhizoryzae]MCK7622044.1 pyridoxal-dependent decarboxylase [Streptomyces rhizoryzae]